MTKRISAAGPARSARAMEKRAVKDAKKGASTRDSFQSFALKLGIGTDNPLSNSTYGFNPITRNRTLLEWIHRGSWLGGVAVDLVADDMTRARAEVSSQLKPEFKEQLSKAETSLGFWDVMHDTFAWGRLYGGSLMVILIEGQDMSTPLRISTIGKGQVKGFTVLDRWMVDPSMGDLVSEPGPNYGEPRYYTVVADAPALRGTRIHFSRVLRFVGVKLPYWQSLTENLWGVSIYERIYDRMIAFDSATQGAAQLVYKSHLRVLSIDSMREAIAAGGAAEQGLIKFVLFMAKYQGIEGVTLIDGKDKFEAHTHGAISGIAEALLQFGQQLGGALQIPLVRLFGESPAGLNSSGESDLRTYYDGINKEQNKHKEPIRTFYLCIGKSEGIPLGDNFDFKFSPLWQMTDEQKSEVGGRDTETVTKAFDSGIIDRPMALKELRQSGRISGRWTNITDEDIKAAEEEPVDPDEMAALQAQMEGAGERQPEPRETA
jgi:uncharacterized protein